MLDSTTAHVDTFCARNLPPREDWPELVFDLPALDYPDRVNCATALLDDTAARLGGGRPCLLTPTGDRWSYADLRDTANRIAHVLTGSSAWSRAAGCCCAARTTRGWRPAGSACSRPAESW